MNTQSPAISDAYKLGRADMLGEIAEYFTGKSKCRIASGYLLKFARVEKLYHETNMGGRRGSTHGNETSTAPFTMQGKGDGLPVKRKEGIQSLTSLPCRPVIQWIGESLGIFGFMAVIGTVFLVFLPAVMS